MRITLFLVGLATAAAAGCHHGGRRCGCQQGCVQGCNRGCCDSMGCAPQANGPGRAAIRSDEPMPPAPSVGNRNPAPVQGARPESKPRTATKEVKFSPQESSFGRAKDFSWLIGQIRRVHVNGGSWKMRYAPLDVQDKWGGSVILGEDARIDRFQDGDFVYVEGEILATRPTVYLAGPLYRISLIRLATQADRQKAAAGQLQRTAIRK